VLSKCYSVFWSVAAVTGLWTISSFTIICVCSDSGDIENNIVIYNLYYKIICILYFMYSLNILENYYNGSIDYTIGGSKLSLPTVKCQKWLSFPISTHNYDKLADTSSVVTIS